MRLPYPTQTTSKGSWRSELNDHTIPPPITQVLHLRNILCSRSHQPCKEAHKWKYPPGITTDLHYSSAKCCSILARFSVFTSKVHLLPQTSYWINLLTLHIHKCFSTLYPCFTLCECHFSLTLSPKVWLARYFLQQIVKWLSSFYNSSNSLVQICLFHRNELLILEQREAVNQ